VGAAAVDVTSQPEKTPESAAKPTLTAHSTSPGQVSFSSGGVGRNVAEAAHRILSTTPAPRPHSVLLVSPLGNDSFAGLISGVARKIGMRTDGFLPASDHSQRSAVCNLHLDTGGNLVTGVADMTIVQTLGAAPVRRSLESSILSPS
jgi:pseudouridine-5'-phosphate glycosidase/pseudouridine kinase